MAGDIRIECVHRFTRILVRSMSNRGGGDRRTGTGLYIAAVLRARRFAR